MGAQRTAWHFFFGILLRRRGPKDLVVRDEVPLSSEPPRLDYLLVQRPRTPEEPGEPTRDGAVTLRRLWPMLSAVSVVEYKSPSHPYRRGHLDRLWGYIHLYFAGQCALPANRSPPLSDVQEREELSAVLVVARRTPSMDADLASMGLSWEDCGAGYWRVHGGLFPLFVVEIDVAGPADGDELLYSLGHGKPITPEARKFWLELTGSKEVGMTLQEMEEYDELMRKFLGSLSLEQRLAGLPPEELVAGVPPEQRLAGLDHDHQALALPIDVLRLLPEEYLRSVSPEVAAELRRRLERNGH